MSYAVVRVLRLSLQAGVLLGAVIAVVGGQQVTSSRSSGPAFGWLAIVVGVGMIVAGLAVDRPLFLAQHRMDAERRRLRRGGARGFDVIPPEQTE